MHVQEYHVCETLFLTKQMLQKILPYMIVNKLKKLQITNLKMLKCSKLSDWTKFINSSTETI